MTLYMCHNSQIKIFLIRSSKFPKKCKIHFYRQLNVLTIPSKTLWLQIQREKQKFSNRQYGIFFKIYFSQGKNDRKNVRNSLLFILSGKIENMFFYFPTSFQSQPSRKTTNLCKQKYLLEVIFYLNKYVEFYIFYQSKRGKRISYVYNYYNVVA